MAHAARIATWLAASPTASFVNAEAAFVLPATSPYITSATSGWIPPAARTAAWLAASPSARVANASAAFVLP
eukprot:jgi/Chrpa1/6805/Chrysochromulina_OHIO_Genome00001178-RA